MIILFYLKAEPLHGIVNQWVSSYLTHSKQYVEIKGTESSIESIQCGVPQHFVLGLKLFNLFLNGICNASGILKCTLFADDTNIIYSNATFFILN